MIVLIPAYEPAAAPVAHLPRLVAELAAADPSLRLLVVDDGSGPAYAAVFAAAADAGAEVLHHDRNRGKGVALKTGFAHALAAYPGEGVVTADADGQHAVADILAVVADVRDAEARRVEARGTGPRDTGPRGSGSGPAPAMVLGCRAFDGDVPVRSRVGNDVARWLFRVAAGWSLSDTQTGLRGMPAEMLPWLLEVPGERFEYEQRVLLGLRRAGFTATERRIATVYLEHNESSHFRPVLDSLRVMLPVLVFAASSLLGFVVDTVLLFVFEALTGALVPSIVAARVLSATANFTVNRRVVFMRRGREGLWRQAGSYALLAGVMLASNVVWMSYLTDLGVPLWVAKVVTEAVLFFTSYRAQRSMVFAADTDPADARLPQHSHVARRPNLRSS
ncbi:MAG: GtrA family protein [Leucobacter sp.]